MGTKNQVLVLIALSLVLSGAPVPIEYPHPRGYVAIRTAAPPVIDGRLDEAAWRDAAWTDDFVDMADPASAPAPRTRVKMVWDDVNLYIGADIAETRLWAEMTTHDSPLYQENAFEFFIDPDGDTHEYYEFEINALNTTWDLLLPRPYRDEGRGISNWEIAGLKSAIHLDGTLNTPSDVDRGWSIEIAVPWKALAEQARRNTPPRDGDQWRMNFTRVGTPLSVEGGRYRKIAGQPSQVSSWTPQYVMDIHRPETWGYVQFERTARPFVPDAGWPARRWLHAVYYAERDFRKTHGRWAGSLPELGLQPPGDGLTDAAIETTTDLFEVSVTLPRAGGAMDRWHVRQDGRIWK
jgi:Carbohydrate family 9 binding domain-like